MNVMPYSVLIVDDNPTVRKSLSFAFKAVTGWQVVGSVENGLEALEFCAHTKPHLILMDVQMPLMDGITATQRIHTLYKEIKIIVFTSFECDQKLQELAFAAGATLCLHKQISLKELVKKLYSVAEMAPQSSN